jgi:hypothetical protein
MKVKLLRKIRKRFKWWKEEDDYTNMWLYYDRETNEERYAYVEGVSTYDSMLIRSMLGRMNLSHLYIPKWKRVAVRRSRIYKRNLKIKHDRQTH